MKNKLEKIIIETISKIPKSMEEFYNIGNEIVYHPIVIFFY